MERGRRAGYKIVSEETWEAIKAAYLRGVSAPVLAAHYGVTTDAIYKKAFREGWTRIAVARRQPPPDAPDAPDAPEAPGAPAEPAAGQPMIAGPPNLEPPPPPRPAPVIDTGRLAASALEGAAALLAEGRLDEAAAYMKLADMGSRVGERGPAEAPTPEAVRRWEAARDFYTGRDPEARDLPAWLQWTLIGLLQLHGEERAHVLEAARREARTGTACGCALCARLGTLDREAGAGFGPAPATPGEAAGRIAELVGEGRAGAVGEDGGEASPHRRGLEG